MNSILRIYVPSTLNVATQHTKVLIVTLDLTFDISGVRSKVMIKTFVCWAVTFSVNGTYILKMKFIIS